MEQQPLQTLIKVNRHNPTIKTSQRVLVHNNAVTQLLDLQVLLNPFRGFMSPGWRQRASKQKVYRVQLESVNCWLDDIQEL